MRANVRRVAARGVSAASDRQGRRALDLLHGEGRADVHQRGDLDQALVAAKPEQKLCFLGDGVERYRTAIESRLGQRAVFAPAQMCYLRPAAAAALAWENRESAVDYLTLQPHYLRAPQAERARAASMGSAPTGTCA